MNKIKEKKGYPEEKLFGVNIENDLKPKIAKITPTLIKELKQMDQYSNPAIF